MSHFTTIKTELRNLNTVRAALRRLGYEAAAGSLITDFYGARQQVDIVARIPGQREVGFRQDPATGVINLVGDFWGGAMQQQQFLDSLKGRYAREQVLDSLEQQGVDLSKVKEVEEPDGTVIFEVPLEEQDLQTLSAG